MNNIYGTVFNFVKFSKCPITDSKIPKAVIKSFKGFKAFYLPLIHQGVRIIYFIDVKIFKIFST